jgi:NTE family protein
MRPAMRLGAERLLVIGLRPYESVADLRARQRAQAVTRYPSALFLAGKLLDALMNDKIEEDLDRVRRMNDLLDAGTRAFGPDFAARLSEAMGRSRPYRPVRTVYIRPSVSLGRIAADIVRQHRLTRATNLVSRMMRHVVASDAGDGESDFASFVLFDPSFVEALVELGYRDAAASHDALVELFTGE